MFRLVLLLLCSSLCFACGHNYTINGTSSVSLLDGKMLFIKVNQNGKKVNIDSTEVIHGTFSMKGSVDSSIMATLYMDDRVIMPFVLEKGQIKMSIENTGIEIVGTALNDKFNEFVVSQNQLNDKAYEVERMESRMIMDGHNYDDVQQEINNKREALSAEMNRLVKEFIMNNYENVLGSGVFALMCSDMINPMNSPLVNEILSEAPVSFTNNPNIKCVLKVADTQQVDNSNMVELR